MGLDSIELVMEVEKYFSISIPDSEAEKAYTIGKLVDCIAKIKGLDKYDFSLRNSTFSKLQTEVSQICGESPTISLNDKIGKSLDISNKLLLTQLEYKLGLNLPGIKLPPVKNPRLFEKFKNWMNFNPVYDFTKITWKKYVDVILAHNLQTTVNPASILSKYEIYLVLMRLTVDKIGVDYFEIGIEKSFTDDLGVD